MWKKCLNCFLIFNATLGTTVVFIAVLYLALGAFLAVRRTTNADPLATTQPELKRDLVRCRGWEMHPYYYWRRSPCTTGQVNEGLDGTRKTIKNPKPGAKKVFCFGGSTLWGEDASDGDTIPSKLQSLLGRGYDVYNYGQRAFSSVQELNLLLEELTLGHIPDLVVFYDGGMDTLNGVYSPGIPRSPQIDLREWSPVSARQQIHNLIARSYFYPLLDLFSFRKSARSQEELKQRIPQSALETVDDYIAFTKQVEALGKAYRFKSFFFWQPDLLAGTKRVLGVREKMFMDGKTIERVNGIEIQAVSTTYEIAEKKFVPLRSRNLYFLGHLFDEISTDIYHDDAHTDPWANGLAAREIFKQMGKKALQ